MTETIKKREKWIDNAKGIAMILVIIGHVSGGLTGIWKFNWVFGVHLFMFFLLSGYTLKKKPFTRSYINGKFKRLMVPYFWTCLALSITNVFNSCILNNDWSIFTISNIIGKDIVISFFASGTYKNFGTVNIGADIGAIWFLPALFFALMIMQILLNINDDDKFLGISTSLIALIAFITGKFIWFPFSIQAGMFASFFLWMGYEIKKHNILSKIRWYHYVLAQIIFLIGIELGYCYVNFVTADIADPWISIPVGLAGCMLIYLISKVDNGPVLSYIGRISLTVLCVHLYTINTLGAYFNWVFEYLSLDGNAKVWASIIVNIIFAIVVATIIEKLKKVCSPGHAFLQKKLSQQYTQDTKVTSYIEQGIFIFLLLISYFPIDNRLRMILCSCDVVVFVVIAGYNHGQNKLSSDSVRKAAKTYLIPYATVAAADLLLHFNHWNQAYLKTKIFQYLGGFSATRKTFFNVTPVRTAYFLLVLFACEILSMIIKKLFHDNKSRGIIIILISIFGMLLGVHGYWLPWSFDIVCYILLFYEIGSYCRKKKVLDYVKNTYVLYFLLSSVSAYMIYQGGMEIAKRSYGQYGLVVMGAIAGILVVYQLAVYIQKNLPITNYVFTSIGKAYIGILVVYSVFHKYIEHVVSLRYTKGFLVYWVIVVALEILIGTILVFVLTKIKSGFQALSRQRNLAFD